MLYEGTEELDHVPPRNDKITINQEMYSQFGISDKIVGNQVIKKLCQQ